MDDELQDALEMIGMTVAIEPPRPTLQRRAGGEFEEFNEPAWVKFLTAFKDELVNIEGNTLKVFLFIALSVNRNCQAWPGIKTIAQATGLSHVTVIERIRKLEHLGLLTVRRDNRRVNLYHVGKDYVSVGEAKPRRVTSKVSLLDKDETSKVFGQTSKVFQKTSKAGFTVTRQNKKEQESAPAAHLQGSPSEPDPSVTSDVPETGQGKSAGQKEVIDAANRTMDGYLKMATFPGAKAEARRAAIQSYLGERLRINTETKAWAEFARFVDGRQQAGEERLDVFLTWLTSQASFDLQYWPPRRMIEHWPRAFAVGKQERAGSSGYYA